MIELFCKIKSVIVLDCPKSQNRNSSKNSFLYYFSELLKFFHQTHTKYGKPCCKAPLQCFESQLVIIIPKIQGLCFAFQTIVDFLPILCSLYNAMMNIISLFGSRSNFGPLYKGNIPLEMGHIRDMETNVSNGIFAFIFVIFLKLDTKCSQNVKNYVANPLYNCWELVWNNYSENTESVIHFWL